MLFQIELGAIGFAAGYLVCLLINQRSFARRIKSLQMMIEQFEKLKQKNDDNYNAKNAV